MSRSILVLTLAFIGFATPALAQAPAPCTFSVSGDIRKLYSGAVRESLEVTASSDNCLKTLSGAGRVSLVNGSSEVNANASAKVDDKNQADPAHALLQTDEIPTNLVMGEHDWEIRSEVTRKAIGNVRLEAAGPAATVVADANGNPRIGISYGQLELDAWHSLESVDGQAVVTNLKGEQVGYIHNDVQIQAPPELASIARDIGKRRAPKACQTAWAEAACKWVKPKTNEEVSIEACELVEWSCPGAAAGAAGLAECKGAKLAEKVSVCEQDIERGVEVFSQPDGHVIEAWRDQISAWHLTTSGWPSDVWFYEPGWWYSSEVRHTALSSVRFAVMAPHADPLAGELDLRDGGRVLLRTRVLLAKGARAESLPLPIADALEVRCASKALPAFAQDSPQRGDTAERLRQATKEATERSRFLDIVANNETRAIDDADMEDGRCFVHYDASRVLNQQTQRMLDALRAKTPNASPADQARVAAFKRALLAVYGQQELEITVSRGGAAQKSTTRWLDPSEERAVIPIPALKEGSGMYAVSVRLKGPSTPSVLYRKGPRQVGTNTAATADLGQLEFKANLRPRGHLGWRSAPIRTFVTFPLRFTGFRFPAKSGELKTSSDKTAVQVLTVKAGVMAAIEPWNYDTDRNPWSIPTRFMIGFNMYDLSHGEFSPAFLAGASFTLPILQTASTGGTGNLGTDIAIGAFWEVDLEKRYPFSDGNHFLLTLGLDVLTLFAK